MDWHALDFLTTFLTAYLDTGKLARSTIVASTRDTQFSGGWPLFSRDNVSILTLHICFIGLICFLMASSHCCGTLILSVQLWSDLTKLTLTGNPYSLTSYEFGDWMRNTVYLPVWMHVFKYSNIAFIYAGQLILSAVILNFSFFKPKCDHSGDKWKKKISQLINKRINAFAIWLIVQDSQNNFFSFLRCL